MRISVQQPLTAEAVTGIYRRMAPVYDGLYGALLQPGRERALLRLAPQPGEAILEIGVGTGFSLAGYPRACRVVAIDLSQPMLRQAAMRKASGRLHHVALCRMDAQRLAFADATFDAVYAPYVVNVVPNPIAAAREMRRVCRPDGRIIFLNHFEGPHNPGRVVNRIAGTIATWLTGVDWTLDLKKFVLDSGLDIESIDAVNVPRVSSVVVCRMRQDRLRGVA